MNLKKENENSMSDIIELIIKTRKFMRRNPEQIKEKCKIILDEYYKKKGEKRIISKNSKLRPGEMISVFRSPSIIPLDMKKETIIIKKEEQDINIYNLGKNILKPTGLEELKRKFEVDKERIRKRKSLRVPLKD